MATGGLLRCFREPAGGCSAAAVSGKRPWVEPALCHDGPSPSEAGADSEREVKGRVENSGASLVCGPRRRAAVVGVAGSSNGDPYVSCRNLVGQHDLPQRRVGLGRGLLPHQAGLRGGGRYRLDERHYQDGRWRPKLAAAGHSLGAVTAGSGVHDRLRLHRRRKSRCIFGGGHLDNHRWGPRLDRGLDRWTSIGRRLVRQSAFLRCRWLGNPNFDERWTDMDPGTGATSRVVLRRGGLHE